MAANDTAALVVALSAQVSKFEKDMQSAVAIADKHTKEIESRFASMNSAISSKLSELGLAASSNLGFAGTLLRTLGPAGLAAAVGIGAAVGGVLALADATQQFAEKSKALKEGADTAGLTITQFKLLGTVGKTVGLDFEQTTGFFNHFLANMEELRKGGGPLYEALLKIDSGLVRELSSTKDSAAAIDILVTAYNRLTSATDKLNLSRAAGGKGGLIAGSLLEEVGKQGGVAGLVARNPALDEDQIRRAALLKDQITAIRDKANNIWGSMFSDEILTRQKEQAELVLKIAQYVERIKNGKQGVDLTYSSQNQRLFEDRFAPATQSPLREQGTSFNDRFAPATTAPLRDFQRPTPGADSGSSAVELAILQKNISLLGEAATQTEQYRLKQLQLKAAVEAGGVSQGIQTRALEAFKVAQAAAALAVRERIGVATEDQIAQTKLAQLSQDRIRFGLSENEVQKATVVILREAKDAADALTVRQSYLPGLKQLEIDSLSVRKGLDTLATNSVRNLENALVDVVSGTKSASEAFKTMANAIIADLARIGIRQAITGPLAGLLGGSFGNGAASAGGTFGGAGLSQSAMGGGFGGAAFASGTDYAPGGWAMVGERGPELINLPRGSQVVPNDVVRSGVGGPNVTVGGATVIVQGDASERTLGLIRSALIENNARMPALVVQSVRDAQSRRAL